MVVLDFVLDFGWLDWVGVVLAFASGLFLFLVTGWDNRGYRIPVACFIYYV